MSTRLKERGGGGKIMASKPQKSLTDNTPKAKLINRRTPIASGKENSAALSSSARRNPAAVPAVRWSTSSIPRGKSPNPSDLNPRASGTQDSKDLGARARVLKGKDASSKPNLLRRSSLDTNLGKNSGKARKVVVDSRVAEESAPKSTAETCKIKNNLGADSIGTQKKESAPKSTSETCKDKNNSGASSKSLDLKTCDAVKVFDELPKENASTRLASEIAKSKEISSGSKLEEKRLGCIKVFENSSDNGGQAVNKYPSKLHEKLAALEGRVQRIASDIKRTKEMLDVNNNQTNSKLILSHIQKKISGIENAVGCVMDEDGIELGLSEIMKDNSLQAKNVTGQNLISFGKALNLDELEARFFPHQKVIKNRTAVECKPELPKARGSMSPIDENPIEIEFLSSINSDQQGSKKDGGVLKSELTAFRENGMERTSTGANFESNKVCALRYSEDIALMASEKLEDFDDQENKPTMMVFEDAEDSFKSQLFEIGHKSSTSGWFVSDGEAVLLTHSDGSCLYYDIANSEEKAVYKQPDRISNNLWGDCWLIRAPGADGCAGRYVVAASAGSNVESGFCSWDFYTKNIQAFQVKEETPNSFSISSSRTALAPLTNAGLFRRSVSCTMPVVESRQWWYRPCGPLLISTASGQKKVSAYDIRDGENVLKWDINSQVVAMEYSSPLQWRSRGKVIVAETEAISLWDVSSLTPQPLLSVPSSGKKIYCLHVNNADGEIGGGVRQRARDEVSDGVFCTQDSINILDFRQSTGIGRKISKQVSNAQSIFSSSDSIYIANGSRSRVQQFSVHNGKLVATYAFPDTKSHAHHSSITQVWGNTNFVMGVSGMGLSVFNAVKDESISKAEETVGPDDLYCPTFDYFGSRVLIISRDRPAVWRYLL